MFYKKRFYDRQCSVFFTTSLIISVTLFSIHSMALLGPRKVYFTGISRPYPPPLFTLFTSQLMVQFGNDKNWQKNFLKFFGTCSTILLLWKTAMENLRITQELENLRINEKKQKRIERFFQKMWFHLFPKKHVFLFKVFFFVLITFQLKP